MTDLKIPLSSFKRLIKKGAKGGPIFESSGFVITTTGAITVYAEKRTKKKIFDGENRLGYKNESLKSFPYLNAGYIGVSMGSGGGVDLTVEEATEEIEAILESYDEETRNTILHALGLMPE